MDQIDRKILAALQENCRRPIAEIAAQVGMSLSACARRITILEENGIIEGYGARLSSTKLGYGMTFYVEVSLNSQSDTALEDFERAAQQHSAVLECHLMTGNADYLIKVAAADTQDYEATYRKVIASLPNVSRIQSALVMKTVKPWMGYQL
ncbi:MAG: Lrp/AsnC family transcriptional regulator [Pseudomonadota bacterium]|nr:Lrp/AsnC family transcriptional regulator [Erythrobacter sp.]